MGQRRIGSVQRTRQRAKVHRRNALRKTRERVCRDARMLDAIKSGSLPYLPWVMSWLSDKLEKRSTRITQADVEKVVAEAKA